MNVNSPVERVIVRGVDNSAALLSYALTTKSEPVAVDESGVSFFSFSQRVDPADLKMVPAVADAAAEIPW